MDITEGVLEKLVPRGFRPGQVCCGIPVVESVQEEVSLIAPQRALHRARAEIVNAVDYSVHLISVRERGSGGKHGGGGDRWCA